MKKQYFGILISLSLVSQPLMAAHLSVLSWKDAAQEEDQWESKVFLPSKQGKKDISDLARYALQGDKSKVKKYLKNNPDQASSIQLEGGGEDPYKVTPLHYAVAKGHNAIVKILLDEGANINARDVFGRTPLMWAIIKGRRNVVDILLEDPNLSLEIADNLERTALHWAASKAKLHIADALINRGANVRAQDRAGNTPLHYAASIRYMFGPDRNIDVTSTAAGLGAAGAVGAIGAGVVLAASGMTVFAGTGAMAIGGGAVFALGTTLSAAYASYASGTIALSTLLGTMPGLLAAFGAFLVVAAVIVALVFASIAIDKAVSKQNDRDRRHDIHGRRNKLIRKLLEKDGELAFVENNEGRLPSHFAALAGNQKPQEILNATNKERLWNALDRITMPDETQTGYTPLMYAIMSGVKDNNLDTVGLRTDVGKGLTDTTNNTALGSEVTIKNKRVKFLDKDNITPLKFSFMFQESRKFGDVLRVVNDQDVYSDIYGRNILHYAAMAGNHISKIYNVYKTASLFEVDRDTIIFDENGQLNRDMSAIEYVPTVDPLPITTDIYGATPIHYAAMTTLDGLKFLLNQTNIDSLADLRDNIGQTPLHYAAMSGKEEIVEFLINEQKKRAQGKEARKKEKKSFADIATYSVDDDGYALDDDGSRLLSKAGDPYKITPASAGKTARDLAKMAGHVGLVKYLSKKMGESGAERAEEAKEAKVYKRSEKRSGKIEKLETKKERKLTKKTAKIEKKAEKKRWSEDKKERKLEKQTKMKKVTKGIEKHQEPLFVQAARTGKPEQIKAMIRLMEESKNYSDLLAVDKDGKTALMHAAEQGRDNMAKDILEAANLAEKDKATYVNEDGQETAITLYDLMAMQSAARTKDFAPQGKQTALMIAAEKGKKDVVDTLLKYGKKFGREKELELVLIKDASGKTAYDHAASIKIRNKIGDVQVR